VSDALIIENSDHQFNSCCIRCGVHQDGCAEVSIDSKVPGLMDFRASMVERMDSLSFKRPRKSRQLAIVTLDDWAGQGLNKVL
jgi:hypothetical protein